MIDSNFSLSVRGGRLVARVKPIEKALSKYKLVRRIMQNVRHLLK